MKRIFSILGFLALAAAVAYLHCSMADLAGGGTIETTNGAVTGMVVFPSGGPAPGTQVKLLPAEYDPVKDTARILIDTADESGTYSFQRVSPGVYSVLMVHLDYRTSAFGHGIRVAGDTVTAPTSVLRVPGSIKVSLPPGINSSTGYVYIPGTPIFTFVNKRTDFVVLDSAPAGVVPAIACASINNTAVTTVRYNVGVPSGDTAAVWNPAWKYAATVVLNTSATGANVAGTVTNFPVLIRLNAGNFDFSQALPGGADLCFTKRDTARLPYAIERWDSAGRQAELWVKADTIRGKDSVQSITMYWGNPGPPDRSNDPAVFDTGNGFRGVWHLDEGSGSVGDATINRLSGSRNGNQTPVSGEIRFGQSYSSPGDYSEMGNVCNPGASDFTVCAWIKAPVSRAYRTVVSKSIGGQPTSSYGWLMELNPSGSLLIFMATDTGAWGDQRTFILGSKTYIADTAWHHAAAVVDRSGNGNCKIYIDGQDVSSYPAAGDITRIGAVVNSTPLRFGIDGKDGGPLKGALDECSIANIARSPDWIRLCYMNQRTDNRLVFFRINTNN